MNLLFLTPQLPYPPRQGTAIRNWGLVRHLGQRHAITLLTFAEPGQLPAPELAAACERVAALPMPSRSWTDRLGTLLTPEPDLARRLWSPEFARALAGLAAGANFDVMQVEGLEMAPYALRLPPAIRPPRVVYDAHNAEHVLQQRAFATDRRRPSRWPAAVYSLIQIPRLKRLEAAMCRAATAVTCVSAEDAAALRALVKGLTPSLVPNGIDLSDFERQPPAAPGAPRLVFTGKMDYRPNLDAALWFIHAILPRIRARRPEARFVVVGQKPPAGLLKFDGQAGVEVTGAVDDTRPYIAGSTVYVAPLRMGGGTRFKLLEAMALARPIVSTRIGAEGFGLSRPAVSTGAPPALLADSPEEFAAAVLGLIDDPDQAAAVAAAGRDFVRASYDWGAIIPRLELLYEQTVPERRPA